VCVCVCVWIVCLRRVLALLQFCCCFCCLKFSLSCVLPLFVVVVPNSPLRVLLHLLFIVLVAPNSPLRDLQLLMLPVLLLLLHLGSSPPLH
jgi:hypothetical protein